MSEVATLERLKSQYQALQAEVGKAIIGQDEVVKYVLISIFSNGHCLLVGVPGLAKTLAINSLSSAVKGSFSRIQFTPDLLPADVIGTMIYSVKDNKPRDAIARQHRYGSSTPGRVNVK